MYSNHIPDEIKVVWQKEEKEGGRKKNSTKIVFNLKENYFLTDNKIDKSSSNRDNVGNGI